MRPHARVVSAALGLALLSGCGGPATFVSTDPPPETTADAWYASSTAPVEAALRKAMAQSGFVVAPGSGARGSGAPELVGTKHQLPYVDGESGEPASGPLPLYRLRADFAEAGETHVRLALFSECQACDGRTPYQWEYPGEVLRAILERTRGMLQEKHARFVYPARYRPPSWRRPPHR